MNPQEELRNHLRPVTIVGAAIVASLAVYFGLVEVLRAAYKPFSGFVKVPDIQPFRSIAFGMSAVIILVVLILRPRPLRKGGSEDRTSALRRLQRASLITLVLAEIPAILGLGLFLVGGSAGEFRIFLVVSLFVIFIIFPRRSAWEEWLKG